MNSLREEKRVLRLTYLLTIILFVNVTLISPNYDKGSLVMGGVMCGLLAYSHFIIKKFFPDGDKYILLFSNVLAVIGIAMLYRLDIPISGGVIKDGTRTFLAAKQMIAFTLGIATFILTVVILPDLKSFSNYKYFYLIVTLIFMSMGTLLGTEIGGAKNWVSIGGFSFQPSEFGKITLVAYLASSLKDYGEAPKYIKNIFMKEGNKENVNLNNILSLLEPALVVMICLVFMLLQTDLGSALIFFGISVTMLYIATSKKKYVIISLGLFVLGAIAGYFLFRHVKVRVMIWQDPWKYGYDEGHQLVQGLISMAEGGIFGTGLGLGYPRFVPVVESDFIFSVICEEMGMLIGIAILMLYFLLFYRCMRAAIYVKDKFSRLLAVGYSTMIASQVLVIVGGVTGAIPLTGITLPLVSYGGTSLLITYFSLGIIQKISEDGNNYE
ncbi:FtsW/RodA/SpoVE family cell cycle protein [Clostridium sp. UBA6640]|uniref:FtsW/RodA/SpoVE family cell cycle protein n=1 Tax=Clostridium sp. UBA6640 TaxID=1946370 RepID=UPI0025B9A4C1|nr:FtsW/RodA/SpoVE family cell cycle protein [Clostridium sp. UBA6640]